MDDKFKKRLEEIVFASRKIEKLDKEIDIFFEEITKRRRYDLAEGGLQSAAVIYPYGFAAKICDDDGRGTHRNAFVNLTKYLKRDRLYLSEYGSGFLSIYNDIIEELKDAVLIRIISSESTLQLSITSDKTISSEFQLITLKKILEKSNELKKKEKYKRVIVGFATPDIYYEHKEINEKMILSLKQVDNNATNN